MEERNLDTALLRTFVAVAEREHFGAAADSVFRTQAAVSQQMQRLEQMIGCTLFVRVGRNKRLTEQGRRLLSYARRILNLNDEAYLAMTAEQSDAVVRIGASADCVDTLLPEYLARCAEAYPRLRIDIQVGRSRWLGSALHRGDLDFVLDVEHHAGLACERLRTSPIIWIAGARYHHRRELALPLVVIQPGCIFRQTAMAALDQRGRQASIVFETTTLAGIRAALRAGLGVTPRSIEMLTPDLKIVDEDLDLPPLGSISYNLYRRDEAGAGHLDRVVDLFRGTI